MEAAETIEFHYIVCYFILNTDFMVVRFDSCVMYKPQIQCGTNLGVCYDSYILCTPHMECVPTLGVLAVKAAS